MRGLQTVNEVVCKVVFRKLFAVSIQLMVYGGQGIQLFPVCFRYFHAPADFRPLVFSSGTWALDTTSDGKCDDGRLFNLRATGQYPLPQPAQNPIPLLTGHGHWEQTGACAVTADFDETFTRTGE